MFAVLVNPRCTSRQSSLTAQDDTLDYGTVYLLTLWHYSLWHYSKNAVLAQLKERIKLEFMICRLSLSSQLKERSEHDDVTTTATTTRCSHSLPSSSMLLNDVTISFRSEVRLLVWVWSGTELSLTFKHCLRWLGGCLSYYDVVFGGYHSG